MTSNVIITQLSTRFPHDWVSLPAMRWEKLFADLEGIVEDEALAERDAMVRDLSDGERASTRWQQLAGGNVSFDVTGISQIDGTILSSNDQVIHVLTDRAHVLVSTASVMAVLTATRRAARPSAVSSRLGWPHVFRLLQRDQDRVQVFRSDSAVTTGTVVRVGADFVQICDEAGKTPMFPYAAISAVSCPR